jgi:hypothetical protein
LTVFDRLTFLTFLVIRVTNMGQIILLPLPKEGMPWIFPPGKIRRLRSGANPRSWVPEASMQTPRPPKPPRAKRSPLCVQYVGTLGGCRLWRCCCKVYDSVCHAEGCGLLFAKDCDHRSSLSPLWPLGTKILSEAFGVNQSDSCLCLIR